MAIAARSYADDVSYRKYVVEECLRVGDVEYDPQLRLIVRKGGNRPGRPMVAQATPEYAAVLLETGHRLDRANKLIGVLLDHQWLKDKGTRWYGNFFMFHDTKKPDDQNAVAFLCPWLCTYLLEYDDKLTDDIKERLRRSYPLCLEAIRNHNGKVSYDNIWFLKVASVAMLGLVMERPVLITDAEKQLEQWIQYVSRNGINEFNSTTYAAVNIAALEVLWDHVPKSAVSFRKKIKQVLDFWYADIFMNWHWEADIGAGTQSRAYPRDRLTGKSLVAVLIRRHGGGTRPLPLSTFHYNFVVSDYPVSEWLRAWIPKKSKLPMTLRASHGGWTKDVRVNRTLYMIPDVTLGTQSGYRTNGDQALPFKITYAGSNVEERASFITPVPAHNPDSRTRGSITFAHHQEGPRAIVLYEADMKGRRQSAYLRLVLDPSESQKMIEEILLNGKPFDRKRRQLKPGAVIAWRVGEALVAIRLLDAWGVNPEKPAALLPKQYTISVTKDVGLSLHCLVGYKPKKKIAVNNMSCGFVVQVATRNDVGSLATFSEQAMAWTVEEKRKDAVRDITWSAGKHVLDLRWQGSTNNVSVRTTNGKKLGRFPFYESPLINFGRGGEVKAAAPKQK